MTASFGEAYVAALSGLFKAGQYESLAADDVAAAFSREISRRKNA